MNVLKKETWYIAILVGTLYSYYLISAAQSSWTTSLERNIRQHLRSEVSSVFVVPSLRKETTKNGDQALVVDDGFVASGSSPS